MINQDAIALKTTVGTVTAGTGLLTYLEQINGALSTVTMTLGGILTSIFIYKEIRSEIRKRKAERGELKRRSTDGDKDG